MIVKLQAKFNATNGGCVLQNLIDMYGDVPDAGLSWLPYSDGVMGEVHIKLQKNYYYLSVAARPYVGKHN